MIVGILQFELHVRGAESLKDKRRVVRSVKDRLHREHMVSVAEVGALENPRLAVMGLAAVGNDGAHVAQVLDRVTAKLQRLLDAELGDTRREILRGRELEESPQEDGPSDKALAEEMGRRAHDAIEENR